MLYECEYINVMYLLLFIFNFDINLLLLLETLHSRFLYPEELTSLSSTLMGFLLTLLYDIYSIKFCSIFDNLGV